MIMMRKSWKKVIISLRQTFRKCWYSIRPGHVLPLAEGKLESTDDIDIEKMKYITFEAEQEQYQLYWDDGISVIK